MKIMWFSNAPWAATGYGNQTGLFVPRLRDLGHDVAMTAFYGLYGAKMDWRDMPVYPGGYDAFGNDVLAAHAGHFFSKDLDKPNARGGLVVTLVDVWTLVAPALAQLHMAAWVPVDHRPVPPGVVQFFHRTNAMPIAMSRFGEEELRKAGLNPYYVPHGVDTQTLRPREHKEAREVIGAPEDAFVVGMVAANKGWSPPRKAFTEAFLGFGAFAESHPDALLYLHTERSGSAEGVDLRILAETCGIADKILWVDQYAYRLGIPESFMSYAYSAMNVLLCPSYGEGFGIPIVEAQACGTPVIVNEFSSMPELCGAGWQVKGEPFWDSRQAAWFHRPLPGSIVKVLEEAYSQRDSLDLRMRAREFAVGYDADLVLTEHWKPVLEDIEARCFGGEVPDVVPVNLAEMTLG